VKDPFIHRRLYVGGVSKADLLKMLKATGVELNEYARVLFGKEWFTTSATGSQIETVETSVAMLGYPQGASFTQILEGAATFGLSTCPLELAPQFRLQYLDQAEGESGQASTTQGAPAGSVTVVSPPPEDYDEPQGFYLRRINGVLWLRGYRSGPEHIWSPDDRVILVVRDPVA
jgi:hypothetical protein